MRKIELIAGTNDESRRLDRIVRVALPDMPLAGLYRLFRKGGVRVNGKKAKPDTRLRAGDRVEISRSENLREAAEAEAAGTIKEGADADMTRFESLLVARTEDLAFFDKPSGMLTHGEDSLETLVAPRLAREAGPSIGFRPGPLHRLDRNTSGLVAFSASLSGARRFTEALRERRIGKIYLAILDGLVTEQETWDDSLVRSEVDRTTVVSDGPRSRMARTLVRPVVGTSRHTLVAIRLESGLTHQIRAQAASRGRPLSGDSKYGGSSHPGGYLLHAISLDIPDIGLPGFPRIVEAPLPVRFEEEIRSLFGASAMIDVDRRYPFRSVTDRSR